MNNAYNRIYNNRIATTELGRVRDGRNHDGYTINNIKQQQKSKQYTGSSDKLNLESITFA